MQPVLDLLLQARDPLRRRVLELPEPVDDHDRADAVAGRGLDDVLERRLVAEREARARDEELGRERVGLDLVRIRGLAAERGHRVRLERAVVPAPRVPELVREREALPGDRLRAVDPQHGAAVAAITRARDGVRQLGDDDVVAGALHGGQHARQRVRAQPERRARLTRPLGPAIGVHPRHRPGIVSSPAADRKLGSGAGGDRVDDARRDVGGAAQRRCDRRAARSVAGSKIRDWRPWLSS